MKNIMTNEAERRMLDAAEQKLQRDLEEFGKDIGVLTEELEARDDYSDKLPVPRMNLPVVLVDTPGARVTVVDSKKWVAPLPPGKRLEDFVHADASKKEALLLNGTEYWVDEKLRLYRKFDGNVQGLEPADGKEGDIYFRQPVRVPSASVLQFLFESFFSQYNREVVLLWGWSRRNPKRPVFVVPDQEGTGGSVEYDDPEAVQLLGRVATYVGTLHVHPGTGNSPSGTDLSNWRNDGGIHFIFGRDKGVSVSAADGRQCFTWKMNWPDTPVESATDIKLILSPKAEKGNIDSLLRLPAPKIFKGGSANKSHTPVTREPLFTRQSRKQKGQIPLRRFGILNKENLEDTEIDIGNGTLMTVGQLAFGFNGVLSNEVMAIGFDNAPAGAPAMFLAINDYQRLRNQHPGLAMHAFHRLTKQLRQCRS